MRKDETTPRLTVKSMSLDPFWNLAAEDYFLDHLPTEHKWLFLWRATTSVVIGRHQNPWRECNLDALAGCGGVLARRLSGGGAVYHDEGNLNYAVFCAKNEYDAEFAPTLISAGLRAFGLQVKPMGKSSLAVEGHKFSGTAYCYRRHAVMHHGTLLVNSDLSRMRDVLSAPHLQLKTHAVDSEPAPVANLTRWCPELTLDELAESLVAEFKRHAGGTVEQRDLTDFDERELQTRSERLQSWEWRFGHTPAFEVRGTPPGASTAVILKVRNGLIEKVEPLPEGDQPRTAFTRAPTVGQRFGLERLSGHQGDQAPVSRH